MSDGLTARESDDFMAAITEGDVTDEQIEESLRSMDGDATQEREAVAAVRALLAQATAPLHARIAEWDALMAEAERLGERSVARIAELEAENAALRATVDRVRGLRERLSEGGPEDRRIALYLMAMLIIPEGMYPYPTEEGGMGE
jgi:hypothetical protein